MFARKGLFSSIGRAGAVATVVAVALTAVQPSMAFAGSATSGKGVTASTGTSDATDISARRRYYRGGGGAAAAAAFAGIVGTGLAIAATQNRRDYYYDSRATMAARPITAARAITAAWPVTTAAATADYYSGWYHNAAPLQLVIATVKDESTGRSGRWIFLWLQAKPLTRSPRLWIRFEDE